MDAKQMKKHQKKRRQSLINTLNKLEIENCHSCPHQHCNANHNPINVCEGCPTFNKLREVGDELDNVANEVKLFDLPKELTISTYRRLRELDWDKAKIYNHYNVKKWEFEAFLKFHEEKGVTV